MNYKVSEKKILLNEKKKTKLLTFRYNAKQSAPIGRQSERQHNRKSLRDRQEWQLKMANRLAMTRNRQQYVFLHDFDDFLLFHILWNSNKNEIKSGTKAASEIAENLVESHTIIWASQFDHWMVVIRTVGKFFD